MTRLSARARRRARVAAPVVVVLAVALAFHAASAASLRVHATQAVLDEAEPCASSSVSVTLAEHGASSSTATITGLTSADTSACKVATLRLASASGAALTPITVTPATSMTATVPAAASSVAVALVDVDGWALPTSLSVEEPEPTLGCEIFQGGVDTGVPCTVTATVTRAWGQGSSRFAAVHLAISPAPTYQQVARLTFDLTSAFEQSGLGSAVAGWSWATSTIAANFPLDAATVTCSLPVFTAQTYTGGASGEIQVNENKAVAPGTC